MHHLENNKIILESELIFFRWISKRFYEKMIMEDIKDFNKIGLEVGKKLKTKVKRKL